MTPRRELEPLPGYDPAVGVWLAALQEARGRTRARVRDVGPAWVFHHLLQHEAEHRAQIAPLIAQAGA